MNSNKNIIVITSHTHLSKQYILDKKLRILRDSSIDEVNSLRDNSNFIKFISTLPLGAIKPPKRIGYLEITDKKITYKVVKEFS